MAEQSAAILLVGNFLSGVLGAHSASEDLALLLADSSWRMRTVSHQRHRVLRLADMLVAASRYRQDYAVAILSVYSGLAFLWAEATSLLLRLLGKKFILTLHGGALPQFAQKHPGRVRRLLSRGTIVVAPSRYLTHTMGAYRADIRVIPNSIVLNRYPFRLRRPQPRLLWLRAFHEIYNPSLAVETLAILRRDVPEATLTMVGPDKGDHSFERCRARACALQVNDAVTFHPAVPKEKVPEMLSDGDIFLNTSSIDNTPVSLLEAMACGLCVVTTDVGGIPFLLRHDETGLLVPANDPSAMAGAVLRLLRNQEHAARLALNARAFVQDFDVACVKAQWVSLLAGFGHEAGAQQR